jgi:hypothetical protein
MADTPSSFPKFNSLPPEIRNMIWEAALPGPRIIHVETRDRQFYSCFRVRSDIAVDALDANQYPAFFNDDCEARDPDRLAFERVTFHSSRRRLEDRYRFATRAPPPVLLYVCHESFEIASKHHSRVFGTAYSPPEVYFNFKKDTLYLDWSLSWPRNSYKLTDFSWVELAAVRYLAIECDQSCAEFLNVENREELMAMVLSYFPNLEKLTINGMDAYHPISDSGDLVFMHLLPKDVKIYDGPDDDDDYDLFDWFAYGLGIEEELFDPEKLRHYRARRMAKKENEELPPLPEIDCQIITTRLIKERLQALLHLEAAKLAKRKRRERKEELQKTRYRAAYLTGEDRYNLRSRIRH